MEMFNAEHLQEKWDPILNYEGAEAIKDSHRKMVTAVLLENQEKFLREQNNFLYEAEHQPTQVTLLVHQVLSVQVHHLLAQQLVSTLY